MKIQDGQNVVVLPEAIEPSTCDVMVFSGGVQQLGHEGYWSVMQRVSWGEMMTMDSDRRAVKGFPVHYALHPLCKEIVYWPTNDKERDMTIRYCPAMKEI